MQEGPEWTGRAAGRVGARLRGLLLIDPTPETAPAYDRENQRSFAGGVPGGRLEEAGSAYFVQAEQPRLIADRVRLLLGRSS
jgi:hypothetical protein